MSSARHDDVVSASELAEMGHCEQRVLLAHRYGDRMTAAQRAARERGLQAHQAYFAQGSGDSSDSRCFVASCVFGPSAQETEVLRIFRDAVLMPHACGRALVARYYAWSPAICALLQRSPACAACVRGGLRPMVLLCERLVPQRSRR